MYYYNNTTPLVILCIKVDIRIPQRKQGREEIVELIPQYKLYKIEVMP
jgi:hypothetical protein